MKKLDLKMTEEQWERVNAQREKVARQFVSSDLKGKYLDRRINDNTFINFADLILNNVDNAEENIVKIRGSLAILKDGQAVFTNLEKVYLYRYVFAKGKESEEKINLQVAQSQFKVKEARKKLLTAKKNIKSAEENLRCATLGFKEGVIESTDVMAAQTAWQQAMSQKIDAEVDVRMSLINLKKAIGVLN